MTDADLMEIVQETLIAVAPDLDGEQFDPDKTFRDQFDIDSMDFLNFVIGLCRKTGLNITEADYPELQTPGAAVRYLKAHWEPG
jgi:acyl carrier protein